MISLPESLTSPVAEPDVSGIQNNGDLLNIMLDYQMSLKLCNGKIEALGAAYGKHGGN